MKNSSQVITVIWYGISQTGKDPPRAHARLVTEKGLAERPLCGLSHPFTEPQPERGRCRRCADIAKAHERWASWQR